MKYKGPYPFTYDLSELLETLNKELSVTVPEEIMKECDFLTPHYTLTRYSIVVVSTSIPFLDAVP